MGSIDRLPLEVVLALDQRPDIKERLDSSALSILEAADVDRAVEVLEDLAGKSDVRNPSAFVMTALKKFPAKRGRASELEGILASNPDVRNSLDDSCMEKLQAAEPARAVEVLQDLIAKGDVRNPSAFVATALTRFPHKRESGAPPRPSAVSAVEKALSQHPDIDALLDEKAKWKLQSADPERAVEVIHEIASKGDVKNPSAFAMKALATHPYKRGSIGELDTLLANNPQLADQLDDVVKEKLREADSARAVEIIEDLLNKTDIRNPSAFVNRCLSDFPHRRGTIGQDAPAPYHRHDAYHNQAVVAYHVAPRSASGLPLHSAYGGNDFERTLRQYPRIANILDDVALERLRDADPARAAEIIEDVARKTDVKNPSAFVVKALSLHPNVRGAAPATPMWEQLLARNPHIAVDQVALQKLAYSDPGRALEVVQDLVMKPDVRNPSAFISKALQAFPQQRGLAPEPASFAPRQPQVLVPAVRLASYQNVASTQRPQSPSLAATRASGGGAASRPGGLEAELARRGHITAMLDGPATAKLHEVEPDRAIEILDDIAAKGDVRNPSAFVMKALMQYGQKREREDSPSAPFSAFSAAKQPRVDPQRSAAPRGLDRGGQVVHRPSEASHRQASGLPSARPPIIIRAGGARGGAVDPESLLDDVARRDLEAADPARAAEVLEELRDKGGTVRNPSAFVVRALQQFPQARGRSSAPYLR